MAANQRVRVTMADIARESGVSLSTVSMVFADKPGLSPETRSRVLEAAQSLGYRERQTPPPAVRPGKLKTLRMYLRARPGEVPRGNDFYSHVVTGIEAACHQRGINLIFTTLTVDKDSFAMELPDLTQVEDADGLLLVGTTLSEAQTRMIQTLGKSVALVDGYSAGNAFDAVVTDNVRGAHQAASYLIARGHRKIGFVGGHDKAYPSLVERRSGFLQALRENDIQDVFMADATSDREPAEASAAALLSAHPEISAVVGCNDFITICAMHAALSLGLRIPQDISFIGFDDILMAEGVMPPLTTIHIDKIGMGRLAVSLLANRLVAPASAPVIAHIQPQLIERRSVAPCAA